MSDTNFFTKVITYGLVFFAGYYLGGGCENSITRKPSTSNNSKTNSKMEEKIEEYEYRLNELENKLEEKE